MRAFGVSTSSLRTLSGRVALDLYYYDAPHTMRGGRGKPLPVIRAVYGDSGETWVHISCAHRSGA